MGIEIKSLFHKSWFGKGVAPLACLNWCQMVSEDVHTVQPVEVDPPVDRLVGIQEVGGFNTDRNSQNPKFLIARASIA